ncbi:lonely Cys domain-containing protein, partial [Streptomyces althioticus]|uniref:lonely Cys domain-containing protein n=1 Tax=Streptomyces althioticus TaxID=83380 RepID=UPI00367C69CD
TDDGRTLALSVDGVTIRITATGRPYTGTVRTDGFTLPAPADSVADAALTLATATGQDSRGRDLLDLLWALRATSADGTPSLTPATLPEDAYRAARPAGAPASLAVRLSEVLDTAALDADTLARHERTWRELGVADGDLPGLRAELTGLAHALRTAPEVTADPVRTLAARLPGLSATDRNAALALLTPADRERLAADPALVDALRTATGPEEFASVAADLMTQVPTGVGQPVSARAAARTRIARMLRDPEVTARLLKGGTRVVVVPRTEALTSLDAFRFLNGAVTGDGRPWDGVRGVGTRTAAVTEENLLGERTTVGSGMSAYPDGYSTTVHEFAHTVHLHGLDATDRQRVTNAFRTTTRHGEAGAWPDGPLHSRDADGRRSAPNYSSRDEREFFAQLTNVYLRANGGNDPYTGLPRVNAGPEWVRTRQPALYPLLRRLYGDATDTRPTDINPVEATDTENEALARARALFAVAEGTPAEDGPAHEAVRALWDGTAGTHVPQPHPPAAPPVPVPTDARRDSAAPPPADDAVQRRLRELRAVVDTTFGSQPLPQNIRDGLFTSLRVIEAARATHPHFGRRPLDLDGITRTLLHLPPDAPVDAARHFDAFTLVSSAHRRGRAATLDAVAAYGLTRQGYPQGSALTGPDGTAYGRNLTGRPGLRLDLGRTADAQGVHPAPWGPTAYAAVLERDEEGRVLVNGTPVSDTEFAELLRHDPERPQDAPVVLIAGEEDGRNETLAREIADRTGTRAWFTNGDLRLEQAPDGRRVPVLAPPASGSVPAGGWFPADPGRVPQDPGATLTASDGTVFPDSDIHTYPLATGDGQGLTGRAFLDAHDMAIREQSMRLLSAVRHYSDFLESLPGVHGSKESDARPLPRSLADSYVAVGHGDSGRTTVPRRSTGANQALPPAQLGRMLARRPSLRALPSEQPVWMLWCELSATRPRQDLLAQPPAAQHIANETGRTVFASDVQVGTADAENGLPPRLIKFDDPDRPQGHFDEFRPEPGADALAALADLGRLPEGLPRRTTRALHWVRALRRTHGPDIDSAPAREAEFHELIEGFGALEELRFKALGGADPGPLTWSGLQQIAGEYAVRRGWDRSLTAGSLEHLLRAALDGNLSPQQAAAPTAPAAPPSTPADGTGTTPDASAPIAYAVSYGDAREVHVGLHTQDAYPHRDQESDPEEAFGLDTLSGAEGPGGGGRPRPSLTEAEAPARFRFTDDPDAERPAQFRFTEDTDGEVSDGDSEHGGPDLTPEEYLDLLFTPAARSGQSPEMLIGTAVALRQLAREHTDATGEATGALGELYGLARRVLGLRPDTPAGDGHLVLLGSLALDAPPSALAGEAPLASYLRRHDRALGRATRLTRGDGVVRNWTGTGDQVPPLDTYAVEGADGRLSTWPAPWSKPYVVLAQEAAGSVRLTTPDGTVTLDDAGEFARLVTRDPGRRGTDDIVLAFPHDDIETLAHHVADLTGATVWYSEHAPRPSTDWRTGADHLILGPVEEGTGTVWSTAVPDRGTGSEGDFDDLLDLYAQDSATGEPYERDPGHDDPLRARRPEPLTTRDYGIVDGTGDGVLFRKPGGLRGTWQTPRSMTGTEDAPELLMNEQDHTLTPVTERPVLRISADRTLAVEDGAYGQQVFATREAVEASSAKLARAGLAVRLRTDEGVGVVLPTPDGGSRLLYRVTPDFLTRSGQSTEEVCRDFADMLADTSRTSHMVFRAPDGGPAVTAPVNASDGVEVTGTHHLADALRHVADGQERPESADPDWAAGAVRLDDRPTGGHGGPLPGRAYGSALSLDRPDDPRRDALSDASRRIGVNEHAWADVGEGYLVQSVAAAGEHGQASLEINYAKPRTGAGGAHFGYHFVTVVLASEDGTHQISLENHARVSQRAHRHRRAVHANLRNHDLDDLRAAAARLRQEIEAREDDGTDEHLTELRGYLDLTFALIRAKVAQTETRTAPAGSPEHTEAERKLEAAVRAAANRIGNLEPVIPGKHQWYMRMYAKRPGESAHDTNAQLLTEGPSAEANPLTVVVLRGQQALPVSVTFDKGAQQTPEGSRNAIRHLAKVVARTGLWNAANGLPLPGVTVSSRRTARLVGRDLAKVRAEAVAGTFRRELADALAALQAGTPGPHLTADRFTVDPVSARVGRASTGGDPGADTVDVTVDDQRGGPRHVATRGPRGSLRTDGGLRGGSRDDGLDPVAEQWPIGRPVTLTSPRRSDISRGPVSVVPVGEAPAAHRPAGPKGKSPATGTERPPGRWYAYTRTADSRAEPFRYEVADTGHIRLPDGTEIPPGGWRRFGHDFVHEATGTLLRGDSGWIGRVANMEFLAPRLAELEPDPVPHRVAADPEALYVVPAHGSTALRVPLRQQVPPPVLRRDDRPRTVVRSAFDVRRFTHGGDTVTDLTVRLALRPHGEATDAVTARVAEGVERFYNRPGHRLPGGDRLHVTVELVGPDDDPHLTVDLIGRDQPMNQLAWWADADPEEFAHELGHQLFLRDETPDAANPRRLDAPGSLLGAFREQAPDGLAQSGLRPRHLQLWAAVTGAVEPYTSPEGTSWADARAAAPAERREPAWVDPVSFPEPTPQTGPDGAVPPPLPPGRPMTTVQEASEPSDDSDDEPDSDEENEQPRWADTGWLNTVFGPGWDAVPGDRLRETSEALFALVSTEAGEDQEPQSLFRALNRVTRQVLHLPGDARPGPADHQLLGSLALDASSDDLETTDDLARYFVERQIETGRGALDEGTLLRDPAGNAAGRDFGRSGQPAPGPDSYVLRGTGRVVERPAPWQNPYVVVARPADGAVEVSLTPGRTFRVTRLDELAMLISYDSRRPRGADIVLALPPHIAAPLAVLVAGTTGRRVWRPEAPVAVATHPTAGSRLALDLRDGDTGASWVPVDPSEQDGLPGARDLSSDSESDSGTDSDDGELSSSDGDAEFDRLADQLALERRIDERRTRPLITRDYGVIDKRGTGVLFTRPLPRHVAEVDAGDGTGAEADALLLPSQDHGTVLMADRPALHISEDRTLALLADGEGTTGRGRQVYATRAAIDASSARLAAAGAGVRLRADESTGILLPGEDGSYGEPLLRVEPEFLTASGSSEHAFTRDFAQMVAGTGSAPLSHVAFRGPTGDTVATAPVNGQHGREVTGTHHLAQALTEVAEGTRPAGDVTPRWAARQTGRDRRFTGGVVGAPTPGERYGSALSHEPADNPRRAPLSAAARRIGVNEHAWAGVGEGYLIQSVSTTNDSGAQLFTHNHAKPGDRIGPHAPYHFAQVVLASEDGTHQITLENETHSRGGIPDEEIDAIVEDNLDRHGGDGLTRLARAAERRLADARRAGVDGTGTARLDDLARAARALAELHDAEQLPFYFDDDRPEHALALREADRARIRAREAVRAAAAVPRPEDLWFFRAYSKRPGESAHEVNAALLSDSSPALANPLTTVVLHGHAQRPHQRTIRFAREQHSLPDGAGRTIDALARTLARVGLWNRANGLPLPTVTVTGHGNRSQASARKRAEAVRTALGAKLARILADSQQGITGTPLAVRDFGLTLDAKRVRGATDPDTGRTVTVDIDDRRQAPPAPPVAFTGPALPRPTADVPTGVARSRDTRPPTPASEGDVPSRSASRARSRSPQPGPEHRNSAAPPWVMARIRYAEESLAFDKRLGEYLAEHEAVVAEYRKMANAAWKTARERHPRGLGVFGDTSKYKAGVVGTSRPALQQVLRSGNLRELVALLYEGISSDFVPDMLGGREEQHPEIAEERPSRRQRETHAEFERRAKEILASPDLTPAQKKEAVEELERSVTIRTRPEDVRPPLSEAERRIAVNEHGLTWLPATSLYDIAMSAGFQQRSEASGGLVATGTAGSTYRFMLHAARMRDQWGVDLDLGLIRAGMLAVSLTVDHHTFHEVMRGAQLALDDIADHDSALDYTDNWGRYWHIHPFGEQELRTHVARDGRFPDEHAQALRDELEGGTGTAIALPHRPAGARPIHTRPATTGLNHPQAPHRTNPPGDPATTARAISPGVVTLQDVTSDEAERHREALLDALYGLGALDDVDRELAAEALERLDRLRVADPRLRGGFLDLDAMVRRVLLLGPAEQVNAAARGALVRLMTVPASAGVTSLDALSAQYLAHRGVFHPDFRLTDAQGRPRGRNWTGRALPSDFDAGSTGRVRRTPDGTTTDDGAEDAPWRPLPGDPDPYIVLASGRDGAVVVRGLGGFTRSVPAEVLRELLALDQDLANRPDAVLLHVERPGAAPSDLPRALADRLGREVWAATGRAAIGHLPSAPGRSMLLLLDEEGRTTRGQWLASTPAAPDTPPGGTADDRVTALSVAHDGHRSTGYISMDLAQEADGGWSRTLEHSRLGSVTSYTYLRSGYDHGSTPATLPWVELGLPTPYFPNNHGAPGAVMWHTPQGPREDDGPRFARTLARRRSLTSLAPGHPVVPLICYAAARPGIGGVLGGDVSGPLPFVPDPLAVVATGQHMANETGRTVFATVLANSVGPARYNDPETYINLVTDARGRAHRWVMFRPEPAGEALDRRARAAGLHTGTDPAPDAVRERTLRLVRALREIFGPTVDENAEYPALLRGMGALDLMHEADPALNRDGARRFTLDLYEQILARHRSAALTSGPVPPVTPDDHRRLLTEAAGRLDNGQRGPLSDWLALPHLAHLLAGLAASPQREHLARQVLGLDATAPVGETEWSRLLWASFKVAMVTSRVDRGAFAAAVLHMPAPDPARFGEAVTVARQAAAVGRDPRRIHELAAHHLEQRGALAPERLLKNADGTAWGRTLDGTDRPQGTFDPGVITLLGRGPDGSLVPVGSEPAPWATQPGRPAPFVYVADGDADGLVLPGATPAAVPARQFGELVFRDAELLGKAGNTEVIAVVPHGSPAGTRPPEGSLPDEGARNSARNWWTTRGATTLHHDPATGTYTVAMLPGPDGQPASTGAWDRTGRPKGDPVAATSPVAPATNSAATLRTDARAEPVPEAAGALADAWDAHARALSALGGAITEAATRERADGDETEVADARAVDVARRRLEDAEARLRTLGITPEALGAARETERETGDSAMAPPAPRDAGARRWIADQLTEADLPPAQSPPAEGETVGLRDLEAAGITPSVGQRTEMTLRGDDRLPAATLPPLDLARIRMTGPGTWTSASDTAAANASRRLWARAYADFTAAVPEGTDEADASRAWAAAVVLVLPAEPHEVPADSRYAGGDFREAVRRVADHALAESTDADSAAELADTVRAELGLHPRWTTPAVDAEDSVEGTAGDTTSDLGTTGVPTMPTPGRQQPAPGARPGTADGTPGAAGASPDGPAPDTTGLVDVDLPVLDGTDLDHVGLAGFDFTTSDVTTFDFDPPGDLPAPVPAAPTPTALDTADGRTGSAAPGVEAKARSSSAGEPMEGVEMTPAPAPLPTPPGAPAPTTPAQRVYTSPAAPVPSALPPRSLVAYAREATVPSPAGRETIGRLAHQVAAAGLHNRRQGWAPPRVEVTGYGADGPGNRGLKRATAARNHFVRQLTQALQQLQQHLPADAPRLTAQDFRVKALAKNRVPDDWTGTDALAGISRADLGRQATIRVVQAPDAAATQTLDALRRRDRTLRHSPLDVDALASRVLHLVPGTPVDQDTRDALFALVNRAAAAGRATNLPALAAFHLTELGVTDPGRARHFTAHGRRVPGLNWDPGTDPAAELDTARGDVLEDNGPGPYDIAETRQTPWPRGVTPYVVAAGGRHDRVEALLPDGSKRALVVDEFVELVAADVARERLPKDTPIVLAVPFAGDQYLDLPRKLADRTGLTVWAHSGEVTLSSDQGVSTVDTVRRSGAPEGDWTASEPGLAPDPDDDVPDWYHQVVTRPIVSALTGKQIGRASHHAEEWANDFEDDDRHLDRMTTYVHYYPATGRISTEHELPRPGAENAAYRLDMHGSPGRLHLAMRDGTVRPVDEREAGPWLRRRKSLSTLPKDHWIDFVVCWSGAPGDRTVPVPPNTASDAYAGPFVPDPLSSLSLGQQLANSTGRSVRLSYGSQGTRSRDGRYTRTLFADAQGRHRAWALFRPDPSGADLDRMAAVAGLSADDGEVTDEMRAGTLRLVRALRLTFGHDVDDAADFAELLRGVAAVDHMWRSDTDFDAAGPFTLDLLNRVVAAHPETASGVDRAAVRRVLAAAADHWAAWPGDELVGFVEVPAIEAAAQWMRDGDLEDEAVTALDLSGPHKVGEAERSRMFWARVKAEETLNAPGTNLGARVPKVLHLPPGTRPNGYRDTLLDLLTRAFAAGRDATDPDVAAAYDLDESGVYATTGVSTTAGDRSGDGRDYTAGQTPTTVDLARFGTPTGVLDTPWADRKGPAPYLVRVTPDGNAPDLLELTFDGETHRIPVGEFLELLAHDTSLTGKELDVPVVLAYSAHDGAPGDLAERIAQRLGRTVWWTDFPADLSTPGAPGEPFLILRTTPDGAEPDADAWNKARPAQATTPGDAPRPVQAPLPRAAAPLLESFPALTLDEDTDTDEDTDADADAETKRERTEPPADRPAPAWVLARIRYAQEALLFEQRLAAHLGENEQVNAEFGKVVRAFWNITLHNRFDYRLFGSRNALSAGAVGQNYESLARVVESGNLRERVTFLFNGVAKDLVPHLMGGVEPQHPVIGLERRDRHKSERFKEYERQVAELRAAELDPEDEAQEMEDLEAMLRTPLRPDEVHPPLSDAEWRRAVRDGVLLWSPAGMEHTLPMSAGFQARSEDSGGLVLTGTSGSAYRIVTHVARLTRLAGVHVDLGLIRAGLASILVGVGHHSFHEVMTGAQLALDEFDPAAASVYSDNWGRYWDVYPLTEEELRTSVAREGLFPDEHARALLARLEAERSTGRAGPRTDDDDDVSEAVERPAPTEHETRGQDE